MTATNKTVIQTYEEKVRTLEKEKRLMAEKLTKRAEPAMTFEEKLEPVLKFLANPYNIWEKGNTALKRTILKLAFADRISYCRIEGA